MEGLIIVNLFPVTVELVLASMKAENGSYHRDCLEHDRVLQ